MPNIVLYLDRIMPARSFDEVELARLQGVYERACVAFDIEIGDPRRETIAVLVFQVADLSRDPEELLRRVIALYGRPS